MCFCFTMIANRQKDNTLVVNGLNEPSKTIKHFGTY